MQRIVRPAVAADIDEAFLWYEAQRPGLRHEFLATANTLINAIADLFARALHAPTRSASPRTLAGTSEAARGERTIMVGCGR